MPTVETNPGGAPADLVLRGGTVHTMSSPVADGPAHTAIAVRAGRVARVGGDADLADLIGPDTRVLDLAGRAVLPGINDGHLHATWLGALWPDTLLRDDGGPFAPVGERPLRSPAEQRDAILRAGDVVASFGITSYTEPGLGPGEDGGTTGAFSRTVVQQYRALAAEGLLRARVTILSLFGELDGPSNLEAFHAGLADTDVSTPDPSRLNFAGVKIFADGIPPMRSAYTHHCYTDGARASLLVAGGDDTEREENLTRMVLAAHRAGRQVGVHATGDRTIDVVLDAVERARAEHDADLRHYLIHGDLVTHAQLRRMARLGVGLSTQPGIAVLTHGMVAQALGQGVGAAAWPLAAALAEGVAVCLSSDAPVLSPDWRRQIAAADRWMGAAGDPRERLDALLRCYTVESARQDGAEDWKGTLAEGMAADLCVLATDPYRLSAAELPDVEVDLTVLAGEVVHERLQRALT